MTMALIFKNMTKILSSLSTVAVIILSVTFFPPKSVAMEIPPTALDSLRRELSLATTSADSVPIMFNIFDCTLNSSRVAMVDTIFGVAERAHDDTGMLEALFLMTNFNDQKQDLEPVFLKLAEKISDPERRQIRILYIKLRFLTKKVNYLSEEDRQKEIVKLLSKYNESKHLQDYEKIEYLFTLCSYLRNETDAELLVSYLNELQSLIDELPSSALELKSVFYSMASATFLANQMYDLAYKTNVRILGIVDEFTRHYDAQGRIFGNTDGTLNSTYNNILKCREVLTEAQMDSCYAHLNEIAARNPRIGNNKRLKQRAEIFYLTAKKRYAEVLPLIKDELASLSNGSTSYSYFVDALIEAADALGSKEDLLTGLQLKNKLLKDRNATKSDINLQELLTLYEVDNIKEQNFGLLNENERIDLERRQQSFVWIVVASLAVICLIGWVVSLYLHSRRLGKRLVASNSKLVEERNHLKETYARLVQLRDQAAAADKVKNDFVENMSNEISVPLGAIVEYSHLIADYAEEDERPYIRDYADVMSVNTDLMLRLVNDLLDLPKLESGSLNVSRSPSSVKGICSFALGFIKKHVLPDVEIVFANAGQPDSVIITDPQRVEQVLIQILINAAKFTQSGSITFGYEIAPTRDKITFTVTDTGIGVPRGMEEAIFDRFMKIDPTAQGNGLGLYIARLIASMLDGSIRLDPEYRAGARFIFTVPIA